MNKVFVCNCLPNGLEFGGVVVAETEAQAKEILLKKVEQEEWQVEIEKIKLIEVNTNAASAVLIDPNNDPINR